MSEEQSLHLRVAQLERELATLRGTVKGVSVSADRAFRELEDMRQDLRAQPGAKTLSFHLEWLMLEVMGLRKDIGSVRGELAAVNSGMNRVKWDSADIRSEILRGFGELTDQLCKPG